MNEPQQHTMRRLGIIDLMAITTAVAFVFMLHGASRSDADPVPETWLFYYPFLIVHAITLGLVLPAIYWIPVHYARTRKMFSQPGHWMLGAQFVVAIWSIGFWIAFILLKKFDAHNSQTFFMIMFASAAGSQLMAMAISIIAAIKLKEVRWKIVLILLAVSFATQALEQALQGITMRLDLFGTFYRWSMVVQILKNGAMVIASIGIIATVLVDWKSKVSLDWLHRVGLVSQLATLTVLPLLEFLFTRFMMMQNL